MSIKSTTLVTAFALFAASTAFAQQGAGGGRGGGDGGGSGGGGAGAIMAFGAVPNNTNRPGRTVDEVRTDCGWKFYTQSGQRQPQKDCSRR